jgi:hypothetical protein
VHSTDLSICWTQELARTHIYMKNRINGIRVRRYFFLMGDQQHCWKKSQKGWEPIVNIIEVSVSLAMTKQTWTTVQPIKHASMENTYFCWQCKIKEYFLSYGHWTCLGALGRLIVLYNILFFFKGFLPMLENSFTNLVLQTNNNATYIKKSTHL